MTKQIRTTTIQKLVRLLHKPNEADAFVKEHLPRGSGVDCGTTIVWSKTDRSKITFEVSFHHMDEHGGYDGWTEHLVIVTPEFDGINIRVTGRDRNGIKEYLADLYHDALTQL